MTEIKKKQNNFFFKQNGKIQDKVKLFIYIYTLNNEEYMKKIIKSNVELMKKKNKWRTLQDL